MTAALIIFAVPNSALVSDARATAPSIQLRLTKDLDVITVISTSVTIIPGESNETLSHKRDEGVWEKYDDESSLDIEPMTFNRMTERVRAFLEEQGSPFADQTESIISASTKYGIDPRLLIGISGAESTFGLHMPAGSHNPFGLGPNRYFTSYSEAFDAEAQFIQQYFTSRGVFSPHQIGPSYTGTGSTTWGASVASVMARI